MTFDYYDGANHEMVDDTKSAAHALVGQLQCIHPKLSTGALWAKVGVTEMIGIDDFGRAETFTVRASGCSTGSSSVRMLPCGPC